MITKNKLHLSLRLILTLLITLFALAPLANAEAPKPEKGTATGTISLKCGDGSTVYTDECSVKITFWNIGKKGGADYQNIVVNFSETTPTPNCGPLSPREKEFVGIFSGGPNGTAEVFSQDVKMTVVGGKYITLNWGVTKTYPSVGQIPIQNPEIFSQYDWSNEPKQPESNIPLPVKPPCKEAAFFYDEDDLQNTYTGEPSLNFTREQLVTDMIAAIQKFEQEGGAATNGVQTLDAPFIAQSFDSGALPTQREDFLRVEIMEMSHRKQGQLTPGEVFFCALKATKGNVRDALVTAHAVLFRDKPGMNRKLIDNYLTPIRNPDGYVDKKTLKNFNDQKQQYDYVSARDYAGNDQQGAWYHLFGMAALEFTDRNGLTPFKVVQEGAEIYKPSLALPLSKGFPMSEVCGKLSNYAVALENQVRTKGWRRPPDPDKQCINYAGAAIGTALAKYMSLPVKRGLLAKLTNIETRRQWRTNMDYAYLLRSPASLMIHGKGGEEFSFDQKEKVFSGNTSLVYMEPLVEEDGTWGLLVVPFFDVQDLRMDTVKDGNIEFAFYDFQKKGARGYSIDAKEGDRYSISHSDSARTPELKSGTGSVIQPSFDQLAQAVRNPPVKILTTGNVGGVRSGPTAPTTFRITVPARLVMITNYHWNNGRGALPGNIGIRLTAGGNVGSWPAAAHPGSGGAPNAYWTVEPGVELTPGNYTVVDSDPASWACNAESGGRGMSEITLVPLGNAGDDFAELLPTGETSTPKPEDLVETITVPTTTPGTTSSRSILENGRTYSLQVSGNFSYWDSSGRTTGADALYDYRGKPPVLYSALVINGKSLKDWIEASGSKAAYRSDHVYTVLISGNGKPLTLSIFDPGPYSDNSGSLSVKLRRK